MWGYFEKWGNLEKEEDLWGGMGVAEGLDSERM